MTKQITYNPLPTIFYPEGFNWEAGQSLVATGEVAFAVLNGKLLDKDGKYSVQLKIDKETFVDLKKPKGASKLPLTGVKKVERKVLDEDGNEEYDDEGEVVKEFSHYQLLMKQNATFKKDGEVKTFELPIVDATDPSKTYKFVPNGSKVSIKGKLWETQLNGKPALGINLQEVRVWELEDSEFTSDYVDPFAAMGLASIPKKEHSQESSDNPENVSGSSEDLDDDIPM